MQRSFVPQFALLAALVCGRGEAVAQDAIIRMTYSRNADGSVRQLGEQSTDFGATWSPNFDFTYRKRQILSTQVIVEKRGCFASIVW
jgi:hypothetical protein